MKALVKTRKGVGFIELREVPEPVPGPGEVKLRIAACGVCGTDLHVRHDTFPYWPPVILGHEFAGTVVGRGPDCRRFREGDRVVGEPHTRACGVCPLCRSGNLQVCPDKRSPGWGIDGGMAEFLCYPERLLHRIPGGMSWDQAAMVEPTANAVTDLVERAAVTAGDLVVVQGPGPIGLLAALVARAAGAREVVIVGTPADEERRLGKARELGFGRTLVLGRDDPVQAVLELSGGQGADLVAECSGNPGAIAAAADLVRKRGRLCAIGLTGGRPVELPWDRFAFRALDLHFCLSTSYTSWDRAIHLIHGGAVPAHRIISHREPLERWEAVFDAVERMEALKALLIPAGPGPENPRGEAR